MSEKNVKIPFELMKQTVYLLEYFNDSCDPCLRSDFDSVYYAFLDKWDSLNLRELYSKIIFAKDEDSRFDARMQYLQKKRLYKGGN